MKQTIPQRVQALRTFMQAHHISAFIIPSTDPHSGEYVPAHWESRKWISGFTGSAGTLVVTQTNAGLWTDSRYFLQAEEQLKGSGVILFKDRLPETPSIPQWLGSVLPAESRIGLQGEVNSVDFVKGLQLELNKYNIQVVSTEDPFTDIWTDRPALPHSPLLLLPLQYSGVSYQEKLAQIHAFLAQHQAEGILISELDEIAWTLNLRGTDVKCNPVFISYLLITDRQTTLYILPEKITPNIKEYLSACQIEVKSYYNIEDEIKHLSPHTLIIPPSTNYTLYTAAASRHEICCINSPIGLLKAVKNQVEIQGFHHAMQRDGVAMVRFLKWLKENVTSNTLTEYSIDQKLTEFRAAQKDFQGVSFETIAGYQSNGAIVHYTATTENAATLHAEGLLLLDSGAQYLDGTTDITRTIVLGPLTEEQKKDYTLVLKGFIALSQAVFPQGTCGTQLDILARQFMWKNSINYGHGTGHGVGHFLCVHEGPHQIRMNHVPTALLPGMTITNEPGIYKENQYGIRIENTMLVTEHQHSEFGKFYQFEPLTLCPIDTDAIQYSLLTETEVEWLNQYHSHVYNSLAHLLEKDEQLWLENATQPIHISH